MSQKWADFAQTKECGESEIGWVREAVIHRLGNAVPVKMIEKDINSIFWRYEPWGLSPQVAENEDFSW